MPSFDTPESVSVTVELGVGDIQIVASERSDTVVDVQPTDPAKTADVTAAEHTRVEFANGRLLIKTLKGWRQYSFRAGGESIDVQIAVPTGSTLRVDAGVAAVRATGRLGECSIKTGVGEVQLDQSGPVRVKTGSGDVNIDSVHGEADVATGSGAVHIANVGGTAVIKNSNGDSWLGDVAGDLRVSTANGKIFVDRARSSVVAKTAYGDVRIGEVDRGDVVVQTAFGKVDIGVRHGSAAWLDLNTNFGILHNGLEASDEPDGDHETVAIKARSGFGDIEVRRVLPTANDASRAQR